MVTGEYDPLAHLEDVVSVYEKLGGPKELWVLENNFHSPRNIPNLGGIDAYGYLADWLRDAVDGRKPAGLKREMLVRDKEGLGAYSAATPGIFLPERLGIQKATHTAAQLGPAGPK
jgi:hypothetical protein